MNPYRNYLYDLGHEVKKMAVAAREAREKYPHGSLEYGFQAGRMRALAEVITLMQQQAQAFEIDLKDIRLHDVNSDKDFA